MEWLDPCDLVHVQGRFPPLEKRLIELEGEEEAKADAADAYYHVEAIAGEEKRSLEREIRRFQQDLDIGEEITELFNIPVDHCVKFRDQGDKFSSYVVFKSGEDGYMCRRDDKAIIVKLSDAKDLAIYKELTTGGGWRKIKSGETRKKSNSRYARNKARMDMGPEQGE